MAKRKSTTTFSPKLLFGIIFLIGIASLIISPKNNHKQKLQSIPPSPTPDATKKWKTYASSEYSFKYPDGWRSSRTFHPAGEAAGADCHPNCKNANIIGFSVGRVIYKSFDDYKKMIATTYPFPIDTRVTTISGESALIVALPGIIGGGYCCSRLEYFVLHKGLGYEITYEYPKLNLSKLSQFPTPNPDILSTFKFID